MILLLQVLPQLLVLPLLSLPLLLLLPLLYICYFQHRCYPAIGAISATTSATNATTGTPFQQMPLGFKGHYLQKCMRAENSLGPGQG